MAAGNRHLGFKEVLNALEDQSPGAKAAFLFGFFDRGHERFATDDGRTCELARVPRVRRADDHRRRSARSARCARARPATHRSKCRSSSGPAGSDGAPPLRRPATASCSSTRSNAGTSSRSPRAARSTATPACWTTTRSSAQDEGITVRTTMNARMVAVRPTLSEYVLEDAARRAGDLPEGPRTDPDARRRLPRRARARVGRRLGRAHDDAAARDRPAGPRPRLRAARRLRRPRPPQRRGLPRPRRPARRSRCATSTTASTSTTSTASSSTSPSRGAS